MNEPIQRPCQECSHLNEWKWVLCDACGARLPWAPPEKPKLTASELTDEQLVIMTKPLPKKNPFSVLIKFSRGFGSFK